MEKGRGLILSHYPNTRDVGQGLNKDPPAIRKQASCLVKANKSIPMFAEPINKKESWKP